MSLLNPDQSTLLTHNARWLSVIIRDIELISIGDKELFDEIGKHLSVRSTDTEFSKVAYDQRHEQNNKVIKARNGYINLTNKELIRHALEN